MYTRLLRINLRMNHIHLKMTEGLTPIDFKLLQLFSIVVMTDLIQKFPYMANVYRYFCGCSPIFSEPCLYGIDGVIPALNLCSLGRYLPMACKIYKLILCQRHYCYCSDTNNGK